MLEPQRRKDYYKQYYVDNFDKIADTKKRYYESNKSAINSYQRQHWKQWYANNKELEKQRKAEHYQKNKDRLKIQKKLYRERNKDKLRMYGKLYRQRNAERLRIKSKNYYENNPDIFLKSKKKFFNKLSSNLQTNPNRLRYNLLIWSKMIRSNKQCEICHNGQVEAHHLLSKKDYPSLMFNLNNGVALCKRCHFEVHGRDLKNLPPLQVIGGV